MSQLPFSTYIVLAVVSFTALGLLLQCLSSYKEKRAEYLSFPIAVFILLPYPIWAVVGMLRDDSILLLIMVILGLPNIILSTQYFLYEWPKRAREKFAPEDKVAIGLTLLGFVLIISLFSSGQALQAAEVGGLFFTSCLMLFSYLVKIWRVYRGQQNINGLKWIVLITLAVQYAVMVMYGRNSGIWLLQFGYIVAELSCLAAITFKLTVGKSADQKA